MSSGVFSRLDMFANTYLLSQQQDIDELSMRAMLPDWTEMKNICFRTVIIALKHDYVFPQWNFSYLWLEWWDEERLIFAGTYSSNWKASIRNHFNVKPVDCFQFKWNSEYVFESIAQSYMYLISSGWMWWHNTYNFILMNHLTLKKFNCHLLCFELKQTEKKVAHCFFIFLFFWNRWFSNYRQSSEHAGISP